MTTPRGRLDTMSHGELAVALRWWSDGDLPTEAAVELLIAHGVWLHRPDFRTAALRPVPGDASAAAVDWPAALAHADDVEASVEEVAVLRVAVALAGHGTTPLRALLAPLSRPAAAHVVRAVAHAVGLEYYRAGTTPPLGPAVLRPIVPRPGRPTSSGPAPTPPARRQRTGPGARALGHRRPAH